MSKLTTTYRGATATLLLLAVLGGTAAPALAAGPKVEPIASGFAGPLGLAVRDDGKFYVAEAFAGQLTMVRPSGTSKVVYQAQGASVPGVAVAHGKKVVFTESVAPEEGPATDTTLERLRKDGTSRTLASLQSFEVRKNPDRKASYGFLKTPAECLANLPDFAQPYTGIVESNPYAVAVDPGKYRRSDRGSYLVADAAGNSIVRVSKDGKRLATVAVLPPIKQEVTAEFAEEFGLDPCVVGQHYYGEPVPTDVEVGRDGHYYVSSLPGIPEAPGYGSVWRIDAKTGKTKQVATGFSGAVDLAVAPDGKIYVAELFAGRISVINAKGKVSTFVDLDSPGAVEVTRKGAVYATTGVFGPEGGSLVRLR